MKNCRHFVHLLARRGDSHVVRVSRKPQCVFAIAASSTVMLVRVHIVSQPACCRSYICFFIPFRKPQIRLRLDLPRQVHRISNEPVQAYNSTVVDNHDQFFLRISENPEILKSL